jgi:Ca-activated chloride channel homolog
MMAFGNYRYLIYIAAATFAALALFVFYLVWKRRMMALLVSDSAWSNLVRGSRRIATAKNVLMIAAILLSGFLLMRPQWGETTREVRNEGSDVLIALDVSRSMLAQDVQPSRLGRAREAIRWIAESLKGDRIGLILFAGDAFLQCPLTNDIGAFTMFLESASPDSIPLQGTDFGRVLEEASRVFQKKSLTSKMLVLITDGEDNEGRYDEYIDRLRRMDVAVYAVGVGKTSGEVVPLSQDDTSGKSYLRDDGNNLVRTRKNDMLLKRIASVTRGSYIDISDNLSGLGFILRIIDDQQSNQYGSRVIRERQERYQVFALLLLVLLSVELMLTERKRT